MEFVPSSDRILKSGRVHIKYVPIIQNPRRKHISLMSTQFYVHFNLFACAIRGAGNAIKSYTLIECDIMIPSKSHPLGTSLAVSF